VRSHCDFSRPDRPFGHDSVRSGPTQVETALSPLIPAKHVPVYSPTSLLPSAKAPGHTFERGLVDTTLGARTGHLTRCVFQGHVSGHVQAVGFLPQGAKHWFPKSRLAACQTDDGGFPDGPSSRGCASFRYICPGRTDEMRCEASMHSCCFHLKAFSVFKDRITYYRANLQNLDISSQVRPLT
jgi:hypothetical protein